MAAATHAASRAAPAVGGGAGAAATAVTQRVPRSVRLAARYPPKRTFDGVRPTQKIIELLRKEQPQTAPQLWVHCKKAGFPNKPYMKKITRTLVNQGKLIARPTGPEGTHYEYLINYCASPEWKHESRPNRPRWKPPTEDEQIEAEGEGEAHELLTEGVEGGAVAAVEAKKISNTEGQKQKPTHTAGKNLKKAAASSADSGKKSKAAAAEQKI